jgi:hypothetical protein
MKKLFLALLVYLNCAPTPRIQTPVVEIEKRSDNIEVKEIETIEVPEKHTQAQKDARFIVKTLQDRLKERSGFSRVLGYTHFNNSQYNLSYDFEAGQFCELNGSPLFKGALSINFEDNYIVNGHTTAMNHLNFFLTPPDYKFEDFALLHAEFPRQKLINYVTEHYGPFPQAQQWHEELLHYLAMELREEPANIRTNSTYNSIVIYHQEKEIGAEEEKIIQDYQKLMQALPKQHAIPESKIGFVHLCDEP